MWFQKWGTYPSLVSPSLFQYCDQKSHPSYGFEVGKPDRIGAAQNQIGVRYMELMFIKSPANEPKVQNRLVVCKLG